jgi:hypothetical protein
MATWQQAEMFGSSRSANDRNINALERLTSRIIVAGKETQAVQLPCTVAVGVPDRLMQGLVGVTAEWQETPPNTRGGSVKLNFGLMKIPYISNEYEVPYAGAFLRVHAGSESVRNSAETLSAHLLTLAMIDYFSELLVASGKFNLLVHTERVNLLALNMYRILGDMGEYTEIDQEQSGWNQTPLKHRFFVATYPKGFGLRPLLPPSVREGVEIAANLFIVQSESSDK